MMIVLRELRKNIAAAEALSGRTLPALANDLKVAALLRRYSGPVADSDQVIRKIRERNPAPEGVEGNALPVALMELRQREIDELLDGTVEVPDLPDDRRITSEELPKAMKAGAGEENRI